MRLQKAALEYKGMEPLKKKVLLETKVKNYRSMDLDGLDDYIYISRFHKIN